MSFRFLAVVICGCVLNTVSVRAADPPTHIVTGISSSNDVLRDLEYLVVTLAGKKAAFEDVVKPNIEIFLIGVDPARPVRMDPVLDAEAEYRMVPIIPISDLKSFLNDNLNPIGIIPKKVRTDRDLYELTGQVYPGWLRYIPGDDPYAILSKEKSDVPKEVVPPAAAHQALIEAGYLVFAELKTIDGQETGRAAAFDKFTKNLIDGIQKRPDETREAYELRTKWTAQQMEQFRQWFVEVAHAQVGLKVDSTAKVSKVDMRFAARPETALQTSIEQSSSQASYFAAVARPEKSLVSLRANWPIDEATRTRYRDIYKLTQPVSEQAIRKDAKATDAAKDARVEFSNLILEVLDASLEIGAIDMFADLVPNETHHNLLLGVRCKGQDTLTKALAVLPSAEEGWEFRADVGEVEGVKLHELSLKSELTPSLKKFFGESGIIYLGVGPEAFWLSTGEGSRAKLEAAIQSVRAATENKPDHVLVSLHAEARELIQLMEDMSKEEGGFDLMKELSDRGLMAPRKGAASKGKETGSQERAEKRQERAEQLANFKWRPIALAALKDQDGQFDAQLIRSEEGILTGEATSSEGVLRAIGALIAQFAEDNLK